jgi:hypothetical protein
MTAESERNAATQLFFRLWVCFSDRAIATSPNPVSSAALQINAAALQTFTNRIDTVTEPQRVYWIECGFSQAGPHESKAPSGAFARRNTMANHNCRPSVSSNSSLLALAATRTKQAIAVATTVLFAFTCFGQETPQPSQAAAQPLVVTVPAGTRIALVLTHPIQSRYVHRGDDIYAQVTSPVNAGNEVVIPPGTFVQGTVEKIERKGGRGELHLQSMSITFPDGYVAPVSGPVTLESTDGYALKDPGSGRFFAGFAMPAAGAGLGALIGHFAASSNSSTITSTLPPGCTGPPPGCLSSSLTVPPNKGESTVIGAAVGGAIGFVGSLILLTGSHNFFMDVGSPVEMMLQQPLSLKEDQVADAVRQSEQHPVAEQPIASRPVGPPPSPSTDHGTCYTPGTPGTAPTVIPGTPGIGGAPGTPDVVIPGTPPTPGTPYPCP